MSRAAVIVESPKGEIALIERRRAGLLYYVLPGGTVQPGEQPEAAAVREAYEELGLRVAVDRLVARVTYGSSPQWYFRATITGGEFGTGKGEELASTLHQARGTYLPVWMPASELAALAGWPKELFAVLARVPTRGWPDHVLDITEARRPARGA